MMFLLFKISGLRITMEYYSRKFRKYFLLNSSLTTQQTSENRVKLTSNVLMDLNVAAKVMEFAKYAQEITIFIWTKIANDIVLDTMDIGLEKETRKDSVL